MSWLDGRVAVVTGASRGIGRATAAAIADAGAHVVAAARSEIDLDGVTTVRCDVSEAGDVRRLFAEAERIGPPAVLVCAAGVVTRKLLVDTTDDDWSRTLAVNLTGTFLCCRSAFPAMRDAGGGKIVTIASLGGVYATEKFPGLIAYNVSKYGVVGLTEGIAVEGRDHGIAAVCLSPGAVDTQMLREAVPGLKPRLQPDDVGRLIVSLLETDLLPLSGANLPLFSNM